MTLSSLSALTLTAPFQYLKDIGIDTSPPFSLPSRLSGAHIETAIKIDRPDAAPSVWAAAGSAFIRDGICTAAGAAARYGASTGLQALTAAYNVPVTIVGATVGAFSWAYVGAGLAGAAVPEKYADRRDVKIAAAVAGGVSFGIAGTLPSILGYFGNPFVNAPALRTISNVFYAAARDPLQIALKGVLGPRCQWLAQPYLPGIATTALVSFVPLTVVGALKPYLPDWVNGVFGTALLGGVDGVSGVLIRDKLFNNYSNIVAGSGKLVAPDLLQSFSAVTIRVASAGLVLSQDMALNALELKPEQPNLGGMVDRYPAASAKFRPWLAVKVQDGLGKTFQAENWNGVSADAESTRPVTEWKDNKNNVQLERIQRIVSERQQRDRVIVSTLV